MNGLFELLTRRTDVETFEPGEPIYREGEPGTLVFCLVSGEVALERAGREIDRIHALSTFGEEAAGRCCRRTETARARSEVRVVPIGPALRERLARARAGASDDLTGASGLSRMRRCTVALLIALLVGNAAHATKRRAFVTSVAGPGDLGSWPDSDGLDGYAAGDAICRARALAGGLPNAGAYRAWLSTQWTDADCHVRGQVGAKGNCGGVAGDPAGPWYLMNGITPFTGALEELVGDPRAIFRPVSYDEFGDDVALDSDWFVWTGTHDDGSKSNQNCGNWSSSSPGESGHVGLAVGSSSYWTLVRVDSCDLERRLLCLEPGASEPAPLWSWSPAALVFATSARGTGELATWPAAPGATGVAAGDEICRALAHDAHLPAPDSFVAWLSSTARDARDVLVAPGPFKRLDGLTVAGSKTDLLDGSIAVGINMNELGEFLEDGGEAWTGTLSSGAATNAHCADWSVGSNLATGTYGAGSMARTSLWTAWGSGFCAAELRLYCVSNVTTLFWDGFELTGDSRRWSNVAP